MSKPKKNGKASPKKSKKKKNKNKKKTSSLKGGGGPSALALFNPRTLFSGIMGGVSWGLRKRHERRMRELQAKTTQFDRDHAALKKTVTREVMRRIANGTF